jgi:hypothetical protein
VSFFQQRLQLALQPDAIAGQLVLSSRHCPPQPLLDIRHKAQRQFLRYQSLHQAFGISEILLASPPPAIGQCLGQMQRSRLTACAFPLLAYRFPVPFQCFPNRLPILGRGFHHDFHGLLLEQPCGERPQLFGVGGKPPPLKLILAVDFNVRDNYGQHLFMHIDSRYPVGHSFLLLGAESVLRLP